MVFLFVKVEARKKFCILKFLSTLTKRKTIYNPGKGMEVLFVGYLTERERYIIEYELKNKTPVALIAKRLNRHRSTIYDEIKRGTVELIDSELRPYKKYCADVVQRKYEENKTVKGVSLKIGSDMAFAHYVEEKIIKEHYSPYAVLCDIKNKGLNFDTHVCEKTIYNYIHKGIFLNLKRSDLPRPRRCKKPSSGPSVTPRTACKRSIEERPLEALNRAVWGFWEMDTVYSCKGSNASLLVLSERMTRQEIILKLKDRTAQSVVDALNFLEGKYEDDFSNIFKSITVDNGVEFSDSDGIEKSVFHDGNRTTLYYCHPYSSFERGTNENTNSMIRRFIPKGSDISNYTDEDVQRIEDWVNNYPRKIFDGLSSNLYLKLCQERGICQGAGRRLSTSCQGKLRA